MEPGVTQEANSRPARIVVPVLIGIAFLGIWEFLVRWLEIPKFVLPPPSMIFDSLINDYGTLFASMWCSLINRRTTGDWAPIATSDVFIASTAARTS